MEYYVHAYTESGSPILGNLDFQGRIGGAHYKRTNRYKDLISSSSTGKYISSRVDHFLIRNGYDGPVVERIGVRRKVA